MDSTATILDTATNLTESRERPALEVARSMPSRTTFRFARTSVEDATDLIHFDSTSSSEDIPSLVKCVKSYTTSRRFFKTRKGELGRARLSLLAFYARFGPFVGLLVSSLFDESLCHL